MSISNKKEIRLWKKSPIHPEYYSVSDDGRVRNNKTGKELKANTDKDGYMYYVLCYNGDRRTVKAHRLVAEAWIPNPDNKPAVDHINGDRMDNRADNLRWVTNKENTNNPNTLPNLRRALAERDAYAIGAIRNFGREKTAVYKDGKLLKAFESQHDAAEFTGVSEGKVSMCINGKKNSCKGYVFKRLSEEEKKD